MTRRPRDTGSCLLGLLALVVVVALAALPSPAAAPPVPVPEAPGPGPLFNPDEIHANPLHLSVAVLGATSQPITGLYSTLGILYAGEHTQAWKLEGPLTNRHSRVALGTGTLVLGGFAPAGPLAHIANLGAGQQVDCWALLDTDRFRAIPPEWLKVVNDGQGLHVGGDEATVYSRILALANFTSSAAFRSAVRKDVTYFHVFNEPDRYRGKVVHVEGRLLRIHRHDPPFEAAQAGVNDLYEAWIFNEHLGTNPYCVLFTEWPRGLSHDLLGEIKLQKKVMVSFDGFFFKKYRYTANDRQKSARDAPLVIAHTLLVLGLEGGRDPGSLGWMTSLLWVFAGVFVALIFGVVGLTVWYRRSDTRVRRRLLARMPEFALPPPDAPPTAPPMAMPVRQHADRPVLNAPRLTFPSAGGDRGGEATSDDAGGGSSSKKDEPPDEGAGA